MNKLKAFGAAVFVVAAALGGCAHQPEQASAEQANAEAKGHKSAKALDDADIAVKANGQILLSKAKHSPVYAEFEESPELTIKLRDALKGVGLEAARSKSDAKAVLTFKGDVALLGGKQFFKGKKLSIGEATEKTLADPGRPVQAADVTQPLIAMAVNKAALRVAMNNFSRGLAIGGMANALGDATGVKGWFNNAVAGDPRGICLSRCEDWNKVSQTAYIQVTLQTESTTEEIRAMAKVVSETVAPDRVIQFGVGKAVEQIKLAEEMEPVAAIETKKD